MLPHMHHRQEEFSHTKRCTALTNPYVTEGMNKVLTEWVQNRTPCEGLFVFGGKKSVIYMCLMYAVHIEASTCAHA